jgi:hypothetical protein
MTGTYTKARNGARWIARSSVGLALVMGVLGLAFVALTRSFYQHPQPGAEMVGLGPVMLLIVFMLGFVAAKGVTMNYRYAARAIAWVRTRFDR